MARAFDTVDRELLDTLLDQLIPANSKRGIPGAGEFGVAEFILAESAVDPALGSAVAAVAGHARKLAGGMSPDTVRQLERDLPEAFQELLVATYKGYYSRPEARGFVGVGTQPVHPKGYEVARESAEFMADLTAPVRARGPIYRDPTGRIEDKS